MNTTQEDDLIFRFDREDRIEEFDDNAVHGPKSTMKRVDRIIEKNDKVIFLEVKDPDMPDANNPGKLLQELQSNNLIHDLAGKYRDSLLFTNLRGGYDKPIDYVVLISMAALENAFLISKTDALKSAIPVSNQRWNHDSLSSCMILNLDG